MYHGSICLDALAQTKQCLTSNAVGKVHSFYGFFLLWGFQHPVNKLQFFGAHSDGPC